MGTQTMGSQQQKTHALAREGSLYSLTLDEVQHQLGDLGKPLSSMNLDELLKSVWIAEANQGMGGFDYSSAQNSQAPSVSSLNKQPSLSLTKDLSHKTVDEVWQNIQQNQKKKKSSLGEMTLEDFLVKAGVVAGSSGLAKNNSEPVLGADSAALNQQSVPPQAQWMNFQLPAVHQPPPPHQQQQNMMTVFMPGHSVQQSLPMGANTIMDATYADAQMNMSPSSLMGTLSDTQTPGRKRGASGEVVEKTVERRQKRMIKNRESAARSRARKQAYTNELENKISRLEEENERLKRQQEVEKVLPSVPPPEPKFQLRRTSSAPL